MLWKCLDWKYNNKMLSNIIATESKFLHSIYREGASMYGTVRKIVVMVIDPSCIDHCVLVETCVHGQIMNSHESLISRSVDDF